MVKIFMAGIPWGRIAEPLDFIKASVFLASDAYKKADKRLLEKAVKNHLTMFKDNILQSDFVRRNFSLSDTNNVERKIFQV